MITATIRRRPGDGDISSAWVEALESPVEAMAAIEQVAMADLVERFETETTPEGASWAPRSPVTIEIRRRRGQPPGNALVNARFAEILEDGRRLVVGVASRAARRFQFGNPSNKIFGRGRAPIPGRRFLPRAPNGEAQLDDAASQRVLDAFREGMRAALRRGRALG